jgi:hypothetical protein
MSLDYSIFNATNAIYTAVYIVTVLCLGYLIYEVREFKWKVVSFVVLVIVSVMALAMLDKDYNNALYKDTKAYTFKLAIESGTNKGVLKDYYKLTDDERDRLNSDMQHIDLNKAELGYLYGYGYGTDNSRQFFNLYLNSTIKEKGLHILIPLFLIIIGAIGDFIVSRSIQATNYIKENNKDEIAKQNTELKRLQELAKQYDINTLKQNAKEISDKIEDLLDKQKYLESDIDEKKRLSKKIEECLAANEDKLKDITNQIEEENNNLQKIKERKEKALDLPFV